MHQTTGTTGGDVSTVADVIRLHGQRRPDRPAITCDDRTVTFGALDTRSSQLAQALAAEGVGEADRVAFLDTSSIEFFEVLFGTAKLGAVLVAISWRLAPPEMAEIVNDAHATVVIVSAAFADAIASIEAAMPHVKKVVVIGAHDRHESYDAWLAGAPAVDPGRQGAPQSVVLQLYTSGTTGQPKGVMLTEANLMTLSNGAHTLALTDDSINLAPMPLFHIGGSGYALVGLQAGCHTLLVRQIDPGAMLDLIVERGVTNTFVVPAVLQIMLAVPGVAERDFSALRTISYGASPISVDVLTRSIATFGCDFVQVYGLTETTGTVTLLDPDDHRRAVVGEHPERLRSAGRPLPGVEVRIVDVDTGADVATGAVGEIWVRSAQVTPGYWRKPEETAAALPGEGWFRTGDAGYVDAEGYLYVHDRVKDMIISGAENVYPAQVENVLMDHPDIADVAVIGVPSERWGETVKAIVVVAPGTAPAAEEIIAFCRERLAHYKCPTSVAFADALPRNPSGKILKRELRAVHAAG
ncbi:MAG TPA: long-chain-fatty-acid--CoA ligase [Mycobacteriales bacterium]|nr:long-chain-fatty-acid--CoA ligase [Mycobacteriales bacterium]